MGYPQPGRALGPVVPGAAPSGVGLSQDVESWLRANVRRCACWSPFSSESRPGSHVTQKLPSTVSPTGQSQHWGRHCPPSTQPLPRLTPFSLPVHSHGADQLSPCSMPFWLRVCRGQAKVNRWCSLQ